MLYGWAADYAAARGIILADTKLEFGRDTATGKTLLADEIFTPDSSRFWPADQYKPGGPQPSFDKQYLRDYLKTLTTWNKTAPGPELPPDVVANTRAKYQEALERLSRWAVSRFPVERQLRNFQILPNERNFLENLPLPFPFSKFR